MKSITFVSVNLSVTLFYAAIARLRPHPLRTAEGPAHSGGRVLSAYALCGAAAGGAWGVAL